MFRKILLLLLLFPSTLLASISTTPSHIVLVQTDATNIWGVYYFAVHNKFTVEKEFITQIRLPRESIDFQAGEGLTNDNISILEDGVLKIHKTYKVGLSLQAVQFKVPVKKDSENVLSIEPVQDIAQLYIATPQSELLSFSASGFEKGIPPMLEGSNYTGIFSHKISAGQRVKVTLSGFPGGRFPFFVMALCMGLLLFAAAALLSVRTSRNNDRVVYD